MTNNHLITSFAVMAALAFLPCSSPAQGYGQYGRQEDLVATMGVYHTGDFYRSAAGVGLGLMLNIGRTTDVLNASVGAEYVEYLSEDPRPEGQRGKLPIIGAGGQVVVPAFLKLQLFPTSKWTKFYVGCGYEMGFRVYENKILKDYYENGEAFHKKSRAIVPVIGWRSRNVDFGVYYKHYTSEPFNHSTDGRKDLGRDKARIGYHLKCFF